MSFTEVLKTHWPIICTAAGCVAAFATLSADVANVKSEQASIKVEFSQAKQAASADHDAIVRVDERTKTMAEDMKELKDTLKEIARK